MARKMTEDFIGTCQWCHGEYKISKELKIVLHGYLRPGYGYTMGRCSGYNHSPFEYETSLTVERIAIISENIQTIDKQMRMIDSGKVNKLKNPNYLSPNDPKRSKNLARLHKSYDKEFFTTDDSDFEYYLKKFHAGLVFEKETNIRLKQYFSDKVANWKKSPIIGIDLPASGNLKTLKDAYDPAVEDKQNKYNEKKAERSARDGKITLTLYKQAYDWDDNTANKHQQIEQFYIDEIDFKRSLKAYIATAFPADKIWTGNGDEYVITRNYPELRNKRLICVSAKIDWKHLAEFLNKFDDTKSGIFRKDNSKKDIRIWVDNDVLGLIPS